MRQSWMWGAVLGTATMMVAHAASASAPWWPKPSTASAESSVFRQSDWSGPRVGFTVAPGDGAISRRMHDNGLGDVVSQFGWQFEHQVTPVRGGPRLVTELVPLAGGVEYGKFVPTVNGLVGVRFANGYEFGAGPSITLADSQGRTTTGLLLAAGKSLDFNDVCIPLNLAISLNPRGTMVTLITGYAMRRVQ